MTQAALKMKMAQESGDPEEIKNAARLNWQFWTIIQAELLDPECTVPTEIRANVLSLANFIDGRMLTILSEPDPSKLDVLISINRELAAGMREGLKNAQEQAETAASDDPTEAPGGTGDISA